MVKIVLSITPCRHTKIYCKTERGPDFLDGQVDIYEERVDEMPDDENTADGRIACGVSMQKPKFGFMLHF